MQDSEWTTVTKKERVRKVVIADDGSTIDKAVARKLQRELDIMGFVQAVLSDEAVSRSLEGWRYVSVLRGDAPLPSTVNDESSPPTCTINVNNKWGDRLLFVKRNV